MNGGEGVFSLAIRLVAGFFCHSLSAMERLFFFLCIEELRHVPVPPSRRWNVMSSAFLQNTGCHEQEMG